MRNAKYGNLTGIFTCVANIEDLTFFSLFHCNIIENVVEEHILWASKTEYHF